MEYFDSDYEKYDDMENPKRKQSAIDIKSLIEQKERAIRSLEESMTRIHEYFSSPEDIKDFGELRLKEIETLKKELVALRRKLIEIQNGNSREQSHNLGDIDLYEPYEDGNTDLFESYEDEYTTDLFEEKHKKM